ncbi:hypothetical protein [Streptomyces sp. NPDC020747]|uniref:hypothetical protein n=1 Tax=Streptomyces sp. NPDC020747 TaxID=3365086 RepID=UPI00379375AD
MTAPFAAVPTAAVASVAAGWTVVLEMACGRNSVQAREERMRGIAGQQSGDRSGERLSRPCVQHRMLAGPSSIWRIAPDRYLLTSISAFRMPTGPQ